VDYFAPNIEDFNEEWNDLIEYLIALREVIVNLSGKKLPGVKIKDSWMHHKFNEMARALRESQFQAYGDLSVPDDELDHIVSVHPFD
jgi:hypothetical protein